MSYSNQPYRGKRQPPKQRSRWWLVAIMFVITVAVTTFFVMRDIRQNADWVQEATNYRERLATWIDERKQHISKTVVRARKEVGVSDESERVVAFEFYDTLQDMQSMQVEAQAQADKNLEENVSLKPAVKLAEKSAPAPSVKPVIKSVAKPKVKRVIASTAKSAKYTKISHAADLEKDLLATMKKKSGRK